MRKQELLLSATAPKILSKPQKQPDKLPFIGQFKNLNSAVIPTKRSAWRDLFGEITGK